MNKDRVLIVISVPFLPPTRGCSQRTYKLVRSIIESGYQVHLLYIRTYQEVGNLKEMSQLVGGNLSVFYPAKLKGFLMRVVDYFHMNNFVSRITSLSKVLWKFIKVFPRSQNEINHIDSICARGLIEFVRDKMDPSSFKYVLVQYVFNSGVLEVFTDQTIKIIDTHDSFSDRSEKAKKFGIDTGWFSTTPAEESKGLNRADIILAIQSDEAEEFSKLTSKKVITLGHKVTLQPLPNRSGSLVAPNILFVGSDNPQNVNGIRDFIEQVYRKVLVEIPDCQLVIAGTVCRYIKPSGNYTLLGVVDDLSRVYALADLVINPVQFGTGLSIKSVEALGYGKPLITYEQGARGIEKWGSKAYCLVRSSEEMKEELLKLVYDSELRVNLSSEALKCAEGWNSEVSEGFNQIFPEN